MSENEKSHYTGTDIHAPKIKEIREKLAVKKEAAEKNADGRPTNAYFAAHDEEFKAACERAGVPNTARQASKWMRKRGMAYQHRS